jgi:hypothetical protein
MSDPEELLNEYFALGVAEGREGRDHDTPDGDAQRVRSQLSALLAALSTVPVEPVKPDDHVWVKCPNGHGTITHQHFDVCGCCPECGSVMVSAGQEDIEALRKDAERYRWLRAGNAYAPEEWLVQGDESLDMLCDEGIARTALSRNDGKEGRG